MERKNVISKSKRNPWGCCSNENADESPAIKCTACGESFHLACLSLPDNSDVPELSLIWKCPSCTKRTPRFMNKDEVPIGNAPVSRGSKRPALNSPPSLPMSNISGEDIRAIVREAMKSEFEHMFKKLNASLESTITRELDSVKSEIKDLVRSVEFINAEYEEMKKNHEKTLRTTGELEKENHRMAGTIVDLNTRINYLEQQSRSNNLEIQSVPEHKQENVYNMVTQLGQVVGYNLKENDILFCTRVAKQDSSNSRPRSIIAQLSSPRIRDGLLAATIKFNKSNPQNKLNSTHLGYSIQTPVYVAEHLSPSNKALHAAARVKARITGYKYVWVRNGKIFVRKSDESEFIHIKNSDSVNKII